MQLPRVIIAAVFFVIGALIAIPALTRTATSSRADSTPASGSTVTATATATARTTPQVSATASASAKSSATPTRTPTRQVTRTVRPTPSHVTPKITVTPRVPVVVPLKATVSAVRCPGPEITVKVTNSGIVTEDYTIEQDGQVALADRVGPRGSRTNPLTVKEGQVTRISVTWRNRPISTVSRTVDCTTKAPARKKPPENLPTTGADDAELYAKIATGVAAMITGVIIFWWGGVWPRRRDDMFAGGRKSSQDSAKNGSD